jgi:hypothetical protein
MLKSKNCTNVLEIILEYQIVKFMIKPSHGSNSIIYFKIHENVFTYPKNL